MSPVIIKGLELPASGQQIALFFPYLGHAMGILRLTKVSKDHVQADLTSSLPGASGMPWGKEGGCLVC